MLKRILSFCAMLAVVLGALAGCDNTGEQQRSVVVVKSVNAGAPVIVDVLEQGDSVYEADGVTPITGDDFITQDWLVLEMQNNPYNAFVVTDTGMPHGDFLITHYTITYVRTDGGSATIPTYVGYTSQVVPSGDTAVFAILFINFAAKGLPVLSDLCYTCPSAGTEILMRADITLYGHEVGTERETEVKFSVGASIVDLVIATSDK